MLAMASPPLVPGYQAASTALTLPIQGMSTAPPVSSTTTVLGLAAATAPINASWSFSSVNGESNDSPFHCVANTITTSLFAANAAAALRSSPLANSTAAFGASAWIALSGDDG